MHPVSQTTGSQMRRETLACGSQLALLLATYSSRQTDIEKALRTAELVLHSKGMGARARKGQDDALEAVKKGHCEQKLTWYEEERERELFEATKTSERSCEGLEGLWSGDVRV